MADGIKVVVEVTTPGVGNAGEVKILSRSVALALYAQGLVIPDGWMDNAPGPKTEDISDLF